MSGVPFRGVRGGCCPGGCLYAVAITFIVVLCERLVFFRLPKHYGRTRCPGVPVSSVRRLCRTSLLFCSVRRVFLYLFEVVGSLSRKEVFQPHLPVRLPCYDLAPVTGFTLGRSLRSRTSGTPGFHGLTGGVYKARERIHRAMADARLLANPASWSRVADSNPN